MAITLPKKMTDRQNIKLGDYIRVASITRVESK